MYGTRKDTGNNYVQGTRNIHPITITYRFKPTWVLDELCKHYRNIYLGNIFVASLLHGVCVVFTPEHFAFCNMLGIWLATFPWISGCDKYLLFYKNVRREINFLIIVLIYLIFVICVWKVDVRKKLGVKCWNETRFSILFFSYNLQYNNYNIVQTLPRSQHLNSIGNTESW